MKTNIQNIWYWFPEGTEKGDLVIADGCTPYIAQESVKEKCAPKCPEQDLLELSDGTKLVKLVAAHPTQTRTHRLIVDAITPLFVGQKIYAKATDYTNPSVNQHVNNTVQAHNDPAAGDIYIGKVFQAASSEDWLKPGDVGVQGCVEVLLEICCTCTQTAPYWITNP